MISQTMFRPVATTGPRLTFPLIFSSQAKEI